MKFEDIQKKIDIALVAQKALASVDAFLKADKLFIDALIELDRAAMWARLTFLATLIAAAQIAFQLAKSERVGWDWAPFGILVVATWWEWRRKRIATAIVTRLVRENADALGTMIEDLAGVRVTKEGS